MTFASDNKYVGQFKDGKMCGEGTKTYGDKYVGQFKDDLPHGLGKWTCADGTVDHDGEWENGEPME